MNEPKVTKRKGKYTITLEERHAELLAMFLGTFSPDLERKIINDYWSRFESAFRPALCEPHKNVNVEGWRTQDTMVTSHIFFGLTNKLKWKERFNENQIS